MANMKLFKKADRVLDVSTILKAYRQVGFKTKHIGEWDRWKELSIGGRLQVKIDVYEVKDDKTTCYMLGDSLGRVAAPLTEDKADVMAWLQEHGYKTCKRWHIEEAGMSEELWNEWNGIGTEEEDV